MWRDRCENVGLYVLGGRASWSSATGLVIVSALIHEAASVISKTPCLITFSAKQTQWRQNPGPCSHFAHLPLESHDNATARWAGQHLIKTQPTSGKVSHCGKSLTLWTWLMILIGSHYASLAPDAIKSNTLDHQVWFSALWREGEAVSAAGPWQSASLLLVAHRRHSGALTAKRKAE